MAKATLDTANISAIKIDTTLYTTLFFLAI